MSSISSSDRARYDEQLSRIRDEYDKKEAENTKKKNAEIKRLEERHGNELANVKDSYENRIAELKDRNRQTLNEKDFANNRKIAEVRQAYQDSLKSKTEESYQSRQALRNSYEGALTKQQQVSDSQQASLRNQMQDEISLRDARFSQMASETQQKSKESIQNLSRRLNESHGKERDVLVQGFAETQSGRERQATEVRKSLESRLKDSERQRELDNSKWSQKYTDTVISKSEEYSDNLNIKQQLLDAQRGELKNKYDTALAEKQSQIDVQHENFKDSVNERLNSQIRSRDSKIARLNSKLNNEVSKNDRLRGIERRNLTNAYEDRLSLAELQRDSGIQQLKQLNDERIGKVQDKNDQILRTRDRDFKSQVSSMKARHREEREMLAQQHKDQVSQISNNAEGRVQKILDLTNRNSNELGKYYTESLDVVKSNYENRMDVYREKTVNDQVATHKVMSERFRNMETSFNQKLNQTVKTYENKLAQMQDEHSKQMTRLEKMHSERTTDRDKAGRMQQETLAMKYEAKLAQLNEAHQQQIDRMNRRHEVDMQNLANKVSYSRKA